MRAAPEINFTSWGTIIRTAMKLTQMPALPRAAIGTIQPQPVIGLPLARPYVTHIYRCVLFFVQATDIVAKSARVRMRSIESGSDK